MIKRKKVKRAGKPINNVPQPSEGAATPRTWTPPPPDTRDELIRDLGLALAAAQGRITNIVKDIDACNPRMHPIKFAAKDAWARELRRTYTELGLAIEKIPRKEEAA